MRTHITTKGKGERICPAGVSGAMTQHQDPSMIEPGQWVRHPDQPDWGEGQVQSAIGSRVTVNFEHQGKILINTELVALEILR